MSGDAIKVGLWTKKRKHRSRKNLKQRRLKKKKQRRNQATMPYNNSKLQSKGSVSKEILDFGQCFWNNYRRAMEWQNRSLQMYWKQRARTLLSENQQLKKRLSQISNQVECEKVELEESSAQECDVEMSQSDGDEEDQYEVSEEFMKFIEISLKHKEALKEQRKKAQGDKKVTYTNQTETSDEDEMLVAPEADMGAKRNIEMKELYGHESAKIHGMETAMHLGFIRKCDKNKPVLWPIMALAPTFPN